MVDTKKRDLSGWPSEEVPNPTIDPQDCCIDTNNFSTILWVLQEEIERKFTQKRTYSDVLGASYALLGMDNRSDRVLSCGTFLEFKVNSEKAKLHAANFCRDRLCSMCNWRRSLKIYGQVSQVMDVLEKDYKFLFLTLTVRNCSGEDLPKTVQALYDGWRYLYHKNKEFRSVICGTFRSLEVTVNKKNGTYHPHLHVVLAVKPSYFKKGYITQKRWSELWRSACDLDYVPIVHIQKVYQLIDGQRETDGINVKQAVAEATKYAFKGSDILDPNDMDRSATVTKHFLDALSGRRLCGWTGVFQQVRKDLALDDPEDGDLIHVDGKDINEDMACMMVRYAWRSGAYVQI